MRSGFTFTLIVSAIVLTGLACRGREPAFDPEIPEIPPLPLGLEADLLQIPEDNPVTPERPEPDSTSSAARGNASAATSAPRSPTRTFTTLELRGATGC